MSFAHPSSTAQAVTVSSREPAMLASHRPVPAAMAGPAEGSPNVESAFTLIELLVVISIIGVLAALVVGLAGLSSRKSREARIRIEMAKLINDIENYKSAMGFYPPDHRPVDNAGNDLVNQGSIPAPNQLFYELSGTTFPVGGQGFYVLGRKEAINPNSILTWFGSRGFANAAREQKDVKFIGEFKSSQVKRIVNPPIDVLVTPVPGPKSRELDTGTKVPANPWLYVSTRVTNNPDRFDLWTEVQIGGKILRFSNWEKDPVVISP